MEAWLPWSPILIGLCVLAYGGGKRLAKPRAPGLSAAAPATSGATSADYLRLAWLASQDEGGRLAFERRAKTWTEAAANDVDSRFAVMSNAPKRDPPPS